MLFLNEKLSQKKYEKFISPHINNLYRLAYRLSQNTADAEDITQDLLIKVFKQQKKIYALDNPKPYLSRALYNQFIDHCRKQGKHINFIETDIEPDSIAETPKNSPESSAELNITFDNLTKALNAIAENHRIVIVLHDMEGYTFDEISGLLDIPKGTAKSRLHRAREALKLHL